MADLRSHATIRFELEHEQRRILDAFIHKIGKLGDVAGRAHREPPHLAFGQLRQAIAETDALQDVLLLMPAERFEPARAALYGVRETLRVAELAAAKAVADMRKAAAARAA